MSNLLSRLKKISKVEESSILSESTLFDEEFVETEVPLLNIALSGSVNGGLSRGVVMCGGQSKSFKTGLALVMAKAYMNKHKDSVMIFIDTEFGSPQAYFKANGIDMDRVFHVPVVDVEQMKEEVMNQLREIKKNERVIFVIDSIGNAASRREINNALDGNDAADFTRAKSLKSFFRMVTIQLNIKNIPMLVINHTYQSMSMHPTEIVGGGRGSYYAADTIFIITRSQDKDKEGKVNGYYFTLNVEKSRHVREKSKLPLTVSYDKGVNRYSGILELAIECGFIVQSGAWYQIVDMETGELNEKKIRQKDITDEIFDYIIESERFKKFIEQKYKIVPGERPAQEKPQEDEPEDE